MNDEAPALLCEPHLINKTKLKVWRRYGTQYSKMILLLHLYVGADIVTHALVFFKILPKIFNIVKQCISYGNSYSSFRPGILFLSHNLYSCLAFTFTFIFI